MPAVADWSGIAFATVGALLVAVGDLEDPREPVQGASEVIWCGSRLLRVAEGALRMDVEEPGDCLMSC